MARFVEPSVVADLLRGPMRQEVAVVDCRDDVSALLDLCYSYGILLACCATSHTSMTADADEHLPVHTPQHLHGCCL